MVEEGRVDAGDGVETGEGDAPVGSLAGTVWGCQFAGDAAFDRWRGALAVHCMYQWGIGAAARACGVHQAIGFSSCNEAVSAFRWLPRNGGRRIIESQTKAEVLSGYCLGKFEMTLKLL